MERTCEIDGKPLKRGASRFCSIECRSEARRRKTLATRDTCDYPNCKNPVKLKGRRFCSQEHAGKAKQDRHPCANPDCQKGPDGSPALIRLQRQYCSRECEQTVAGTRLLTFVCANPDCNKGPDGTRKEIQRFASTVRNPSRVYCSIECRTGHRVYARGPEHPAWKGGSYMSGGYRYVRDPSGARKLDGSSKSRAEHIVVAEQKLGRRLRKGEHVHHLNGSQFENRPANLLVLNAGHHRALHGFYSRSFQAEHAAGGDLISLTLDFLAALDPEIRPLPD
jgi:hypothetical protein